MHRFESVLQPLSQQEVPGPEAVEYLEGTFNTAAFYFNISCPFGALLFRMLPLTLPPSVPLRRMLPMFLLFRLVARVAVFDV